MRAGSLPLGLSRALGFPHPLQEPQGHIWACARLTFASVGRPASLPYVMQMAT